MLDPKSQVLLSPAALFPAPEVLRMTNKPLTAALAVAAGTAGLLAWLPAGPAASGVLAADKPAAAVAADWDKPAAARYLDSREVWWQGWDHDKRDHGTRCVSCHTQAPYALARPELRSALGENGISPSEQAMLADVEKRVRAWDTMLPFYSDEKYGEGKEIESRNAESVLNAVILASYDAGQGAVERAHADGFRPCVGPAIADRSGRRRMGVAGLRVHAMGIEGVAIPLGGADGDGRG